MNVAELEGTRGLNSPAASRDALGEQDFAFQ